MALFSRSRNDRRDIIFFASFIGAGTALSVLTPTGELRPFLSLFAFLCALVFVARYSTRPWRSTPAGVAVMVSMTVTMIYTGHASLMLWWPSAMYGYPHWQTVMEIVYLLIAAAAMYKIRALTREEYTRKDPESEDPRG